MALAHSDYSSNPERLQSQSMRQMLSSFYDEHMYRGDSTDPNQLFTDHDKKEALAYFDGEELNISEEERFQRRTRSILMLSQTKAWAQKQKDKFITRLYRLDIALDKKNELREQFLNGSFELKNRLLNLVGAEEERIASKKALQLEERESYKFRFLSFYESNSQYFCYEDRISAWTNVLVSLQNVRSHKAKIHRLQILLAMLPANLAYAKQIETEYVLLLDSRIADASRKHDCLEAFRQCTFLRKAERIAELKQQTTLDEKEELKKRTSREQTTLYRTLYGVFPHGLTPDEFAALPLKKQTELLAERKKQNALEQEQIAILTAQQETNYETMTKFRSLTLKEKKDFIVELNNTPPEGTETPSKTTEIPVERPSENVDIPLCSIVITILRNEEKREFDDDKERVKYIKQKMLDKGVIGEFSLEHLQIIRSLLTAIPEEERQKQSVLQWVAERLRQRIYVGESRKSLGQATAKAA